MPSLAITGTYPQYTNKLGQPLDGKVYFGLPNQNPITSPKQIYWDEALTQPAAQPVSIIGGYITRAGTPAGVFTDNDYSTIVQSKENETIFYTKSSREYDNTVKVQEYLAYTDTFSTNLASKTNMSLGVSLVGGAARIVNSIALLKLLPKTGSPHALVTGYYAQGDGGGGLYYYDSTDLTSADNGGSIIVAADGGRWKLSQNSEYTAKQFGAKGDGLTDDKASIQAALDTGKPVIVTWTSAGYNISGRLALSNNSLRGDYQKTVIRLSTAGEWCAEIRSSNCSISNVIFDCNFSTGGGAILLRTDLTSITETNLDNVESLGATAFIQDLAHASNILVSTKIKDCIARLHRGAGINLQRSFAYLEMENVTIDYVGSAARNFRAYEFRNMRGAFITKCDTTGGLVDATTTNNDGFFFYNCQAVWMTDCMADTVGGNGFYFFGGCSAFYLQNCVSSLCGIYGFVASSNTLASFDLQLSNCVNFGRNGLGYSLSYDGFRLDSVNRIGITGCKSQYSSRAGLHINNSTRITISGGRFDLNAGRGIDSTGANSCIGSGIGFDANTAGNVNLSSTFMHIASSQKSDGGLLNVSGPIAA